MRAFRWFLGGVVLVVLGVLPLFVDPYTQYIVNLALTYVVVAIGLNLLLGYAGQFAFANAAFMGIGAYTTALLTFRLGWPYAIALPLSGILAALLGLLAALPALRMSTVYLAMVSLAFAELVQWILIHWKPVTLGTDGVSVPWPSIFGLPVRTDAGVYYLVLSVTVVACATASRILHSKWGRAFIAIRANEIVAQCSGINVARTKVVAFALSALYAGIGGSLFALTLRFVVPDGFGLFQLVLHFSMVLIGGVGSLIGAVLGAAALTALPEMLRNFQAFQEIVYGVALVGFILFMPTGIAGLLIKAGLVRREILVWGARAGFRDSVDRSPPERTTA